MYTSFVPYASEQLEACEVTCSKMRARKFEVHTMIEQLYIEKVKDDVDVFDIIHEAQRLLDKMIPRIGRFQELVYDNCMRMLLPLIAGRDAWMRDGRAVNEFYGWKDNPKQGIFVTFRRGGKSVIMTLVMLLLALLKPGAKVCVFSQVGRTSQAMRDMAVVFLERLGLKHTTAHDKEGYSRSKEKVTIRLFGDGLSNQRELQFLPGSKDVSTRVC